MRLSYIGSFQSGIILRSAEPTALAWRKIEQLGTIDSLGRIATHFGGDPNAAHLGSLRTRQAIELRNSARGASPLTQPLLLYYSTLNLIRAVLGVTKHGMGHPSHGARYVSAQSILDCKAAIAKRGTLPEGQIVLYGQDLVGQEITLLQCLAQMPELIPEFKLLERGPSDVASVVVTSFIGGETKLKFGIDDCTADQFNEKWQEYFPWFKDLCSLDPDEKFTLVVDQKFTSDKEVSAFCRDKMLTDLFIRQDAVWFDHVSRDRLLMTGRLMPYLTMLFILSNLARYEPEKLDEAMRQPTDLAYALNTAINNVDLYFPQLLLSRLWGQNVYFS